MMKYQIVEVATFRVETVDGELIGMYSSREAAEKRMEIANRYQSKPLQTNDA